MPNYTGITQNLVCILLRVVLKNLELSKWFCEDLMLKVDVAHVVARRVTTHEMTLKLPQNGVKALKISLVWLDDASCDFSDVENM